MSEADKQLVPVMEGKIAGVSMLVVDARELHSVLEVGKDFTDWIKNRIKAYGFEEGKDFELRSPKRGNQTEGRGGDRRSVEYCITLDMAKELAMVERNEKGRAVRKYFLDCERRSQQSSAAYLLTNGQVLDNVWLYEGGAAGALAAVSSNQGWRDGYICFIKRRDGKIKVKSSNRIGVYIARESNFDRDAVFLLTKAMGGYNEFRRMGCEILALKVNMPAKYEFYGATFADIKAVFEPILVGRNRVVQKLDSAVTGASNFTIEGIDDEVGMLMVKNLVKHYKAVVAISPAIEDENALIAGGAMAMLWGLFKRDIAQYYRGRKEGAH